MMLRRLMLGAAGTAVSILSPMAMAQVTPAMDRLPADALVVGTIKNLGQFHSEMEQMARMLKLPEGAMGKFNEMSQMLKTEGVRADGSAAFAMLRGPGEDDEEEGPVVMVLPVTNYNSMITSLGGTPGSGLDQVEIEGNQVFIKKLDGDFAAMSPMRDVVQGFTGAAGSGASFEQMLGASGKAIAEKSDMFFVANIQGLKPQIERGLQAFEEQMQMMAMMAGGAQQPNTEAMKALANDFARDGRSAILGLDMNDAGISFGMAAQFNEGSQTANYFQGQGNASQLIASLPNHPFLMSLAMDTSSPGMKALIKRMSELQQGDSQLLGPMQISKFIDKMDGMAFLWGTTPALMGGMFLNTLGYIQTSDPAGYLQSTKGIMEEMNKKTVNGVTFQTSYLSSNAKVGGRDVDVWTMKMQADPTNPASQQIAQAQMMMFGPAGLSGYAVATEGGVIMTYSKNSALLEQALSAVKTRDGLTQDAGVQKISGQLPDNRVLTGYIGVKNIMEVALGFIGMMGGPAAAYEVPQDLPPLGFGASMGGGGMSGQLFIPKEVMVSIRDLADTMQGDEGDLEEIDDDFE